MATWLLRETQSLLIAMGCRSNTCYFFLLNFLELFLSFFASVMRMSSREIIFLKNLDGIL